MSGQQFIPVAAAQHPALDNSFQHLVGFGKCQEYKLSQDKCHLVWEAPKLNKTKCHLGKFLK